VIHVRDWLGANAFFLSIILIACGIFFVLFSLLRALQLNPLLERYLAVVVVATALYCTYRIGGWFHAFVERRLFHRGR
jgi:inner membrane protein involved in colicin E2 resistance